MTLYAKLNYLKISKQKDNIEVLHICGMNMAFISSSEVKNVYFIIGEANNEIYIFWLHEMK